MSDIAELGKRLVEEGPVKTMPTPRRVRVLFAQTWVADSTSALLVWEHPYYPQFYLPRSSISASLAPHPSSSQSHQACFQLLQLSVGQRTMDQPVLALSKDLHNELAGLVRIPFLAAEWFAEDEPIYVHPKDPTKRVEILHSQRPVKVYVEGHLVADSKTAFHLYETGLPTRYYLPKTSVDWKYLQPSSEGHTTLCPYKGKAHYYDITLPDGKTLKNLVWWYVYPTKESLEVAGWVCFYNEKVDIELDGVRLERPKSKFT